MSDLQALSKSLREAHARFVAAVESIRPDLHRYCSRMTGSALDGEDLVQETFAQAYYRLGVLSEEVPLRQWLFTIAHHKCVDFLRARRAAPMIDIDDADEPAVEIEMEIAQRQLAAHVFSRLVLALPPRERAAVVMMDVLGFSVPETAKVLETSVGAVKSALHRGREKLAAAKEEPSLKREPTPAAVATYIEAFNRRDWTRLQTLLEEDVQCELVGHLHHTSRAAMEENYLATYASLPFGWKLAPGEVDGEPAIIVLRDTEGEWSARHAIRLEWQGDRVARIRDYAHVPYLLAGAHVVIDVRSDSTTQSITGPRPS